MTTPYYPPITAPMARMINMALDQMATHGTNAYLASTPWPFEVKELFERLSKQAEIANPAAEADMSRYYDESGELDILAVLTDLQKDMTYLKNTPALEAKDKIAIMRMSVTLTDKLISQQERATNLKQMAVFKTRMIEAISRYLSPDQREDLLKDLERPV